MSSRTRWIALAIPLLASLMLASCGSDSADPASSVSDVTAGTPQPGPTPFTAVVPLNGVSLNDVVEYQYVITAKAGAMAAPVDVSYTAAALVNRGHLALPARSAVLPVAGLYAGRTNAVHITLRFFDGSTQVLPVSITTAPFVDSYAIYDRPLVHKALSTRGALGFDYIFVKSGSWGPVVIDTDGEVRWTGPSGMNAFSSAFADGAFFVGAQTSTSFTRLELGGGSSSGAVTVPGYTKFHHNIDRGKGGWLMEFDAQNASGPNIESIVADVDSRGVVLAEWDFADILARHMRAGGDDPALFVRPGVDWFHMNAAAYDPRDDSIIASSRENFVVKVDYRTGRLIWVFGDPTKYWYQFPSLRAKALQLQAGGLYPVGQHAVSIAPDGSLLLFNNGAPSFNQPSGAPVGEARPYSPVSAYRVDAAAMTATEAWRFDNGQSILSDICSSAYMTQSGSMLVSYAAATNRTKARIVGVDANRAVLLDLEYNSPATCGTSWNAEPFPFDKLRIVQ